MLTFTGPATTDKNKSKAAGKAFNTTTPNLPRKSMHNPHNKNKVEGDFLVVGHHPHESKTEYNPHNYWPKSGWRGKKKEVAGFKY